MLGGSSGEVVCCVEPNLHPQLSISPHPPPLIRNSFTLLARVLSARDVYQWAPAGVTRRFLSRMSSETHPRLFSTLENSTPSSELIGIVLIK